MDERSNVMPLSNVYVLRGEFRDDREFQARVRGRENLRKMLKQLAGLGFVQGEVSVDPYLDMLTPAQRKEYECGMSCALQEDREDLVWGVVKRGDRFEVECRCYHTHCRHFSACRPGFDPEIDVPVLFRPRDWKPLPSVEEEPAEDIFKTDRVTEEAVSGRVVPEPGMITVIIEDEPDIPQEIETPEKALPDTDTLQTFQEQEAVIRGAPVDKILVLAGPGTGKTYCLIERIKFMVEEEGSIDPENILLLCFTRAAVREIKDRFRLAIEAGGCSDDLVRVEIRTFDSFATLVLRARGVDVSGKDYDERIQMVIDEIRSDPDILQEMRHFMVDEIQDLVGVRARLVQTILECRPEDCGFTLLGDDLQGIYDYQVKDIPGELDAKGLLKWIRERFAGSLLEYSLNQNMRQSGPLADFSARARHQLNSGNVDHALSFIDEIKKIGSCGREHNFVIPGSEMEKVAILCRNNGEVLKISGYLRQRSIDHIVRRGQSSPLLPVWVADFLLYHGQRNITLEHLERVNKNGELWSPEDTWRVYRALESLVPGSTGVLKLNDVRNALAAGARLPDEIYEQHESRIYVSTIHQSKGREYDVVLVLQPGDWLEEKDPLEEGKVYYVAVTRARKKLYTVERSRSKNWLTNKHGSSGRWVELHRRPDGKTVLVAIETGMDGDIDEQSFVDGAVLSDPAGNQQYIRKMVRPGDPLELRRNGEYYTIIHDGYILGKMSDSFFQEIKYGLKEVCWKPPRIFEEVYVDRVYSVVKKPETIRGTVGDPWAERGVWYAVSVAGMGRVRWDFDDERGINSEI